MHVSGHADNTEFDTAATPSVGAIGQRVLVVGSGGAGKSTVAARIGAATGLPVIHLDALHWHAGWRDTPVDEWTQIVAELVDRERWVMDGNYGGTLDIRVAACDTVVFLDLPRYVCLWRAVRRWWRYRGRTRPDMAEGCPERLSVEFLRWIWDYPATRRPALLRRLATRRRDQRAVVLRSPAEVDRFLRGLLTAAEDVQSRGA
jgi:adenylate kinase family enzyme